MRKTSKRVKTAEISFVGILGMCEGSQRLGDPLLGFSSKCNQVFMPTTKISFVTNAGAIYITTHCWGRKSCPVGYGV